MNRRFLLQAAGGTVLAAAWGFAAPRPALAQTRSVVDTLAADGRFGRLLELVSRAGMTDRLREVGPFTVFAPTDAAFAGANVAIIQDLLGQGTGGGGGGGGSAGGGSPDIVRLQAFVGYFVVPGRALSLTQLAALGQAQLPTMNGSPLALKIQPGGAVTVSNPSPAGASGGFGSGGINIVPPAPIVQADILATNGIVHALGGVPFA